MERDMDARGSNCISVKLVVDYINPSQYLDERHCFTLAILNNS
jgi:hypothetical protein